MTRKISAESFTTFYSIQNHGNSVRKLKDKLNWCTPVKIPDSKLDTDFINITNFNRQGCQNQIF